jgi:putative ABC transport system substrate-binding protein
MKSGRRGFLRLAGSATGAWPPAARSQQGPSRPVVAVLVPLSPALARLRLEAVRRGLLEAGLLEGAHYALESRFADGQTDRLPGLARELHSLRPAVFVVGGSLTAALELRPRPPMVFTATAVDPVRLGLVESYARRGGMLTGNVLTALGGEDTIAERRIALFKELVPGLARLGMFGPSAVPAGGNLFAEELSAAARVSSRLGFEARAYRLQSIDDLEGAIAAGVRDGVDGIYVSAAPLLLGNVVRALPLILGPGLPTLATYAEWARAGVLMTYSADVLDGWWRAGVYAGRILQGARPGDLPIEQPTRFTLAINARTARQLGIGIPTALEAAADELIE